MTRACTIVSADGRAFRVAGVFAASILGTAQHADQEARKTLEQIIVTGSRIPRRDFNRMSSTVRASTKIMTLYEAML